MMVLHTVHVELSYDICGVCLREHVLLFPPDPQCSYTVTAGPLQRLNVLLEVSTLEYQHLFTSDTKNVTA